MIDVLDEEAMFHMYLIAEARKSIPEKGDDAEKEIKKLLQECKKNGFKKSSAEATIPVKLELVTFLTNKKNIPALKTPKNITGKRNPIPVFPKTNNEIFAKYIVNV